MRSCGTKEPVNSCLIAYCSSPFSAVLPLRGGFCTPLGLLTLVEDMNFAASRTHSVLIFPHSHGWKEFAAVLKVFGDSSLLNEAGRVSDLFSKASVRVACVIPWQHQVCPLFSHLWFVYSAQLASERCFRHPLSVNPISEPPGLGGTFQNDSAVAK